MPDTVCCPTCGSPLPPDAPQGECPRCLLRAGLESEPAVAGVAPSDASSGFAPTRTSSGHGHFVPPTVAELQQRIPQYEILELIGQGGMGAVYKARQRGLERLVAIKILPFEVSQSASFTDRFTREARALALLSHPHIVAVHDFGQAEGLCYFVMEYVAGVNLRQAIQAGKMNPAEALAIVPQICEALQFAHDEGVVHRDIKPENILIDARGRVKIADFGLAKLLGTQTPEHSLTGTQQVMGTLRYMAPEQMFGTKDVDHRADIFSLGVVFYELLTGELPIGRFAPPSKKCSIDARLDDVVLRALEAEPAQRYQHVSELKTGVDAIARSPAPQPAAPQPAAQPRDPSQPAAFHAPPSSVEPRLSQAALWGAIIAPVFLLTVVMSIASTIVVHDSRAEHAPPPLWIMIPMLGLGAVGLGAPFATTLLGVIAIGQIRRSNGKLYGLPLAVFDALVFPLLALSGILLLVSYPLLDHFFAEGLDLPYNTPLRNWGPLLLTALVVLPFVIFMNVWLVRLTWRAAMKGMRPTDDVPNVEKKPSPEPPPFQPASVQKTSTALVVVLVVLALLTVPLLVICGIAGTWSFTPMRGESPMPPPPNSIDTDGPVPTVDVHREPAAVQRPDR